MKVKGYKKNYSMYLKNLFGAIKLNLKKKKKRF